MKKSNLHRAVAGASALTMAIGMATTFGTTVATADPIASPQTWEHDNTRYERTVSNANPAPGDVITVTTKIQRRWADSYIYQVKDLHPTCLTYVAGSATVDNGTPENPKNVDYTPAGETPAFARLNNPMPGWKVGGLGAGWGSARSFSFQYTVGTDCARNIDLATGVHTAASVASGQYTDKGPSVRVNGVDSTTTLAVNPAPQAAKASTLTAAVSTGGGTVEFFNGTTSLGTAPVSGGTASLPWTPAADQAGTTFSITATYSGDAATGASTSAPETGTVATAPGDDGGGAGSLGSLGSLTALFGS